MEYNVDSALLETQPPGEEKGYENGTPFCSFNCIYLIHCLFFEMFIWFLFSLSVWYISHWFGNIEKSLHPWNKSHLIVLYDPFSVLLVSDCYWFVEDFSLVILVYKFIDFFFLWFWYQGDSGLIEWIWEYSFLCNFSSIFRKIGVNSSLNVW